MPPSRLTLFAPNLSGGGAERVLARLAAHWASQGRDVTLVTLADASPDDFPLPPNVIRVGLGLTADSGGLLGALRNNVRRVRAVRAAFHNAKPDVVVSFIEQANVLALLAARRPKVPVVVSERTDPTLHPVSRLWRFLRRRTYPRCAALVVLTDETAELLRPVARGRPVVVIPNGITAPPDRRLADDSQIILGVGRLDPAKGFDRLVEAFARIANGHPRWKLVIVGDGPQRRVLALEAVRHGLGARVELPGRVPDPADWYDRATLFALPSRYEGFPNALLEAMAHGLPAVAFDGPSAVRRVIRHDVDGLLVPEGDLPAFADSLAAVLSQPDRRALMAHAAREVVTRFSQAAFFARWDAVVDAVVDAAKRDFSQVSAPPGE